MACLVNVTLIDDSESEGEDPEQFQLILQAPVTTPRGQEVIIDPGTVLVTIYDDDGKIYLYMQIQCTDSFSKSINVSFTYNVEK